MNTSITCFIQHCNHTVSKTEEETALKLKILAKSITEMIWDKKFYLQPFFTQNFIISSAGCPVGEKFCRKARQVERVQFSWEMSERP